MQLELPLDNPEQMRMPLHDGLQLLELPGTTWEDIFDAADTVLREHLRSEVGDTAVQRTRDVRAHGRTAV